MKTIKEYKIVSEPFKDGLRARIEGSFRYKGKKETFISHGHFLKKELTTEIKNELIDEMNKKLKDYNHTINKIT